MTLPLPGAGLLVSFLIASALLIIAPGPATFYVAAQARISARHAALAVAGIVFGDLVLIGVAGAGFATVALQWPLLIVALKVVGAVYVAWCGVKLLRTRTGTHGAATPSPRRRDLLQGFLLTLGNPKAILFFAAFFPTFIDTGSPQPWAVSFYALGVVFEIVNLLYFAVLILLVCLISRGGDARMARIDLNKVSGAGLLICAALMLVSLI